MKTDTIGFRLTPELNSEIKRGAALTGRSVSEFADHAIRFFLASDEFKTQAASNVAKLNSLLEEKP